jgi:hypothetical protein
MKGPRAMLVGLLFATGWAIYAAKALPPALHPVGIVVAIAITAVLLLASFRLPLVMIPPIRNVWRWFALNLVVEIAMLNVAVSLTIENGRPAYLVPALSIAVGLHFLPMAWMFPGRRYLLTGFAMLGVAALVIAAGPPSIAIAGLEAAANAVILWGTIALAFSPRRPIS